MPLAWVPYADYADAEQHLGSIPAGLDLDFYRADGDDFPGTIDEERLFRIVDALAEIAAQRSVSISQVALNWVTRKPRVDTVIIGARNERQLRDNLAAATWTLTDAEVERLDEVSALPLPYPHWHQQRYAGDRNPPAKHVR